ncbi:DNA helicase RecQ [Clostridium sp. J1101437_171009_A5]|uniref:DNA helicase RecQ n=1 Tax=Clostridium sp. J1101437_171009_A5 TaxID=2787098 RepID=UPI001896CD90|nr:DNA helicase RecQ [Clostridium sp. J1101437_171009_A5]
MSYKLEMLQAYFGYRGFLPGQERAVDALLEGRDVLSIMPTGAGKSLCFQLPAIMLPGVALVISPLISLMKDQVGSLVQAGIPAAYLNRSLTERQYALALERAWQGRYKIIYVAPERLESPGFLRFAQQAQISMVAVDEAHCVSQWGTDFRPSYLKIPAFLDSLPRRPALGAFTATATPEVREDILQKLSLQDPVTTTTGFDRKNLYFEVRHPQNRKDELLSILLRRQNESGVVYCSTRKAVEEVCAFLQAHGVAATRYHAGLSPEERQANQDAFAADECPVMVATNAFGMGIDKSNVRYVVHYNMPLDLEGYYQEAGRAGRDGSPADCILLYSGRDVITNRYLIDQSQAPEGVEEEALSALRQRQMDRLKTMTFYATTNDCLRHFILRYFGEEPPSPSCGHCSNCTDGWEDVDITKEARAILSAVDECGGRFGVTTIADLLCGRENERTLRWDLDRRRSFGLLSHRKVEQVKAQIRHLVDQGYLALSDGDYPVLSQGPRARELSAGSAQVTMRMKAGQSRPARRERPQPLPGGPVDETLFQNLRALRGELARKKSLPAYVIFTDRTLREMAARKPATLSEMERVPGVGSHKLAQYGKQFLAVIQGNHT